MKRAFALAIVLLAATVLAQGSGYREQVFESNHTAPSYGYETAVKWTYDSSETGYRCNDALAENGCQFGVTLPESLAFETSILAKAQTDGQTAVVYLRFSTANGTEPENRLNDYVALRSTEEGSTWGHCLMEVVGGLATDELCVTDNRNPSSYDSFGLIANRDAGEACLIKDGSKTNTCKPLVGEQPFKSAWIDGKGATPFDADLWVYAIGGSTRVYDVHAGHPDIVSVTQSPMVVPASTKVDIVAEINHKAGASYVESGTIHWHANGGPERTNVLLDQNDDGIWQGSISGLYHGTKVTYYLTATDLDGNTAYSPEQCTYEVGSGNTTTCTANSYDPKNAASGGGASSDSFQLNLGTVTRVLIGVGVAVAGIGISIVLGRSRGNPRITTIGMAISGVLGILIAAILVFWEDIAALPGYVWLTAGVLVVGGAAFHPKVQEFFK